MEITVVVFMLKRDKVTSLYCSYIFACLMLGHEMNLGQT